MKYPLLRISYWAGAIVDGVAALAMIFPALGKKMLGLTNFNPGPDYSFAMGMSASLMLGWTALLIWADKDPRARKGILLLTVFPVIFGIVIAEIIVVASGLIAVGQMIPLWIMQVSLSILFIFSYWRTK